MLFGHPLAYEQAQQYWRRTAMPPWRAVAYLGKVLGSPALLAYDEARTLIDLAPAIIFIMLTIVCARRMPVAFTLYMIAEFCLASGTQRPGFDFPFAATGRYLLPSVPLFLVLSRWTTRRPWLAMLLVGGGFMLPAAFTAFFLSGCSLM